jgi:hypothetical protein
VSQPSKVSAIVFWGKTGTGRTRMLQEVAIFAHASDADVIEQRVEWGPHHEVGYTCLRALISKLVALGLEDRRLVAGHAAEDRLASAGLRELFGSPGTTLADEAGAMCGAVVAALGWAVTTAAKKSDRLLLIMIDDVDLVDGVSRVCLWKFLQGTLPPNVVMLLSSEERPPVGSLAGIHDRELLGLSREDAVALVNPVRGGDRDSSPGLKGSTRRIEPLYLEQYRRWRAEHPGDRVPPGLREIVEARIQELAPAPRRVLQAIAVGGLLTASQVSSLLERSDGLDEATRALEISGFVKNEPEGIRMTHSLYARVALDNAPAGVTDQLHARAADFLATSPAEAERRAYHLLRARPSMEAFMLVEKAVRLRALRGDTDGSIAALSDGYFVSRTCAARGDAEAGGWHVFGRKLATALHAIGRTDQANGLLLEMLQTLGPTDYARAPVLEELASIASSRGKGAEAERWRLEATMLSEPPRAPVSRVSRPAARSGVIESRRPQPSRTPTSTRQSGDFLAKESNSRVNHARVSADARVEGDDGETPSKGRKR